VRGRAGGAGATKAAGGGGAAREAAAAKAASGGAECEAAAAKAAGSGAAREAAAAKAAGSGAAREAGSAKAARSGGAGATKAASGGGAAANKAGSAKAAGSGAARETAAAKAPPSAAQWGSVCAALQKWREGLQGGEGGAGRPPEPSVTTIAERYQGDPWAVLASTILSLRTKDEVTLEASKRLLEKAPGPRELAEIPESQVAALAYPAGFYRNKAASLKKIAGILLERHGGKVPADMGELLALPGVGRKTANLVLIEAFGLPAICVDIHVHRISNRCGWLSSKTPDETEAILREILPKKYWKGLNALLVLYGQRLCRPVSPRCSLCVIAAQCMRAGVERSR